MPNGDIIKPGVRFIDIRSKYRADPEFAKVQAAVNAGTDYKATFHRFWAQADVALAYGVYAVLFEDETSNASISPTLASFDKNVANQADVLVTMTPNGNTFTAITGLTTPAEYTVAGDVVTIKKSYLVTQPVGTTLLTFDFNAGLDPVLSVSITDSKLTDSKISPTTATFDKNKANQADITVTMTPNGNAFAGIPGLVSPADYTVTGNVVTIKKAYLAAQSLGTKVLTFDFSAGVDPALSISIVDTTVVGNLKVQFANSSTAATGNTIGGAMRIVNIGTSPINLSEVKVRYYFSKDGDQSLNLYFDYADKHSDGYAAITSSVSGGFRSATGNSTADTYAEIVFAPGAGSLVAGGYANVQFRIAKGDWLNFTFSNDYSFNPTSTTLIDWIKVPAYQNGIMVWGIEP